MCLISFGIMMKKLLLHAFYTSEIGISKTCMQMHASVHQKIL